MIRRICACIAVLGLAGCGSGEPERARVAPMVSVAAAAPHRFVDRIEAIGTARANEQVTLAAPVTERITRINFVDGGMVRRGQVIAELSYGEETAELSNAQARAREAEQQLKRLEQLKARGFATNASVDAQIANAAAARADAAGARALIGDRVIVAPFSGYASLRTISAGAVVQAGTEIATISDVSRIKLDFTVPETMLTAVREGQPIEAIAAAYPGTPFRGTIATIDPVIDPETRAVLIRAILPNPGNRLKPGMLLTVGVEAEPRTMPAVPELALVGEGDRQYVFLMQADGTAKRTLVRSGARQDGLIEIVEGLKPGDRVIAEGVVKVTDGMKVQIAKPGAAARP